MKYSLVDYILTIEMDSNVQRTLGFENPTISIGGEGSYLDTITIEQTQDTWDTSGDATGGWIHRKSLNRVGTAALSLNMLSPRVAQLTKLFNLYFTHPDIADSGLTLTLANAKSTIVATCIDAYITKIPSLTFSEQPGTRTWTFTAGKVTIDQN